MKLSVVVVDLEVSARAKRIVGAVLGGALLLGGGVAYADVQAWSDGDLLTAQHLNESFASVQVIAASAERTGAVGPGTSSWTTIPGLSATIELEKPSLVQMHGNGVQRTVAQAGSQCHASYRLVIDGTAKGHATLGQRINVSGSAEAWHSVWDLGDFSLLPAGSHTIELQARLSGNGPSQNACWICAEGDGTLLPYNSCTLNVVAVPN